MERSGEALPALRCMASNTITYRRSLQDVAVKQLRKLICRPAAGQLYPRLSVWYEWTVKNVNRLIFGMV